MEEEPVSDPGFARPDLCSIRTAGGQDELAGVVRGGFSADGCPPGGDDPPAPQATGIDRATLTANMAQGWSHGPVGAVVAAWPAVSLVGSYELLVWLIRICGAADRGASAAHRCTGAACRAARPVQASAIDGERPGANQRGTSDPAYWPAGGAVGIPAGVQRDDEALEASAGNDAAVAAYRLSVQAGNPLSERKLAQLFGRTSRRWARARITDARQAPPLPDSPSTPVTA